MTHRAPPTSKHTNVKLNKSKSMTKKQIIREVGTKKQAQQAVQKEAERCGMFYVNNRWLGGMLTNFSTIKKSLQRI